MTIDLNRSSRCTHRYDILIFLKFLISFWRFFRIPGSPGNDRKKNLDNFLFSISKKLIKMATSNIKIHGKKSE